MIPLSFWLAWMLWLFLPDWKKRESSGAKSFPFLSYPIFLSDACFTLTVICVVDFTSRMKNLWLAGIGLVAEKRAIWCHKLSLVNFSQFSRKTTCFFKPVYLKNNFYEQLYLSQNFIEKDSDESCFGRQG
jgi:hypothetical protein